MRPHPSPEPARPRDLPLLLPWTRFFWESGADGQLRIGRCSACRSYVHPPVPYCPSCGGTTVPEVVSGRGRLVAMTANEQAWGALPPPYVVAIVELAEDPSVRLTTNLVDCDPQLADIGLAVAVTFVRAGDVWLPLFRPSATDKTE